MGARRDLTGQDGFTLVELLMGILLTGIISTAVLTSLVNVERQTSADVERAEQIESARVGLLRMTKELREASRIVSRQADSIEADVPVNGAFVRVRYSCATQHPTRQALFRCVREVPAAGTSEVVIDYVINGPTAAAADRVFSYTGTSYVRSRVWIAASGEKSQTGFDYRVVLDDGFYLRNCDGGCV